MQAAMGDIEGAIKTIDAVRWHAEQVEAWLSLADAAAKAGRKALANQAMARAGELIVQLEDANSRIEVLCEIGRIQLAMGASAEAKETRRSVEMLAYQIVDKGERTQALIYLGNLMADLADHKAALKALADALLTIDQQSSRGSSALEAIALAQAKAGDLKAAIRTARANAGNQDRALRDIAKARDIEAFSQAARAIAVNQDRALHGIAMMQLAKNDLAGAEDTTKMIKAFMQYHCAALIAIAQRYASAGETMRAIKVAEAITNDSRKAQAMLEIATAVALRGDKKAAQKIAEGLTYPRPQLERGDQAPFEFRDFKTWGRCYECDGSFTMASAHAHADTAGDLTAAAMRCRVALAGKAAITHCEELDGWDVRKVARAQTAAGDAQGALGWLDGLKGTRKLEALLGVAEGLASIAEQRPNGKEK
jgi:hypothetical protein